MLLSDLKWRAVTDATENLGSCLQECLLLWRGLFAAVQPVGDCPSTARCLGGDGL